MTAADDSHIRTETDGGVLTVTINRPQKRNALTRAMYRGLADALGAAQADPSTGAVVLVGAGGHFTGGNDLADFMSAGDATSGPAEAIGLLHRLASLDAPLVAAVEGSAVGIGTTLLMHCDAAIAGPGAKFKTPFIDLGLCPEGGSSLLFPAVLGRAATMRLLMLGETVEAEEALRMGIVDAITADPLREATALARRLAAKPIEAMRTTKRLLREARGGAVTETIDREALAFRERLSSPEAQAAFRAFFEKSAAPKG